VNDCFQAHSGYSLNQKANGRKRPEAAIFYKEKSILNLPHQFTGAGGI
jgi:hypothetical protein